MAKAKDDKKTKGKKGEEPPAELGFLKLWVGRGRGLGALIGFVVVAWVSHRAGIGPTDAALRGLVGAVAFSFVGWLCALLVITGLLRTAARDKVEREAVAAQAQMAATATPPVAQTPPDAAAPGEA